ncbi:hypothetical protein ALC56_11291, partial [Trachymyrmex septentrionalis]
SKQSVTDGYPFGRYPRSPKVSLSAKEHRADTMAKSLRMERNGTPTRRILYCLQTGRQCHASYRILIARVTRPLPIYRSAYVDRIDSDIYNNVCSQCVKSCLNGCRRLSPVLLRGATRLSLGRSLAAEGAPALYTLTLSAFYPHADSLPPSPVRLQRAAVAPRNRYSYLGKILPTLRVDIANGKSSQSKPFGFSYLTSCRKRNHIAFAAYRDILIIYSSSLCVPLPILLTYLPTQQRRSLVMSRYDQQIKVDGR